VSESADLEVKEQLAGKKELIHFRQFPSIHPYQKKRKKKKKLLVTCFEALFFIAMLAKLCVLHQHSG